MGKPIKDLFNEFKFNNSNLDPKKVDSNMLKSKETSPTIAGIPGLGIEGVKLPYDRQYQKLASSVFDIYGVDAPRILLRGTVDLNKLGKKVVNRAAKIVGGVLGNNSAIGGFARRSIEQLSAFGEKQPSDWVASNDTTGNGLYSDLLNNRKTSGKNPLINLLRTYSTPSQFKQNVANLSNGDIQIGGATTDAAVNLAYKGAGWAASKLGIGKQDSGKENLLSNIFGKEAISPDLPSTQISKKYPNIKLNGLTGLQIGGLQISRKGNDIGGIYDKTEKLQQTITIDNKKYSQKYEYKSNNWLSNSLKKSVIVSELKDYTENGKVIFRTNDLTQDTQVKFSRLDLIDHPSTRKINKKVFALGASQVARIRTSAFNSFMDSGTYDSSLQEAVSTLQDHRVYSNLTFDMDADTEKGDLIKIKIKYFKSNGTIGYMYLFSTITGLTDTPTPNWNDVKAVGSPYKFYFYESFEREISFKCQLYASGTKNVKDLWNRVNELMLLTKPFRPIFGSGGVRGKVCEITIGDFIKNESGFFTSCVSSVPDISPWETDENSQAPFVCELDITFKVINTQDNLYKDLKDPYDFQSDVPVNDLNYKNKFAPKDVDLKKASLYDLNNQLPPEPAALGALVGDDTLTTTNYSSPEFGGKVTYNSTGEITNLSLFNQTPTPTPIPPGGYSPLIPKAENKENKLQDLLFGAKKSTTSMVQMATGDLYPGLLIKK